MHRAAHVVLLVSALLSCSNGPAVVPADCPVVPPTGSDLQLWKAQLDWEDAGYFPSLDELEAADLNFRRRITYSYFFPDVFIPFRSGDTLGLQVIAAKGDHSAAAIEVDACIPLELKRIGSVGGRTSYYYGYAYPLGYRLDELAWLVDWILQTYPDDFIVGVDWNSHNQGNGTDI